MNDRVVFMLSPAISRRRHLVFGLSVRVSVRTWSNNVDMISYKPLVGISPNL